MKIQVIAYDDSINYQSNSIGVSCLGAQRSLDEFEINIIDLRDARIWRNNDSNRNSINQLKEFHDLRTMIENSQKTIIVILLPLNIKFNYHKVKDDVRSTDRYFESVKLKDILSELEHFAVEELTGIELSLNHEITSTQIKDIKISADFYFPYFSEVLTASIASEKATTIKEDEIIYTTLDLPKTSNAVLSFLHVIGLFEIKQNSPEWFADISKYDDAVQKQTLLDIEMEQQKLEESKAATQQKIDKNNKHKSILYLNGEELADEVFVILEALLTCDLSGFVDLNNEDFIIEKDKVVFVGEIKGVNRNVKKKDLSQLEDHVQNYSDSIEENEKGKLLKGLLIISPQRSKSPANRAEIGEAQIALANKYESLIITTSELLTLHEKFRKGKIESEEIIKIFKEEVGLFKNQ